MNVDTADLWTCPSCRKRFVTRNMWHSCGQHTVAQFMEGKSETAWAYWERLNEMVAKCGPYSVVANKTRIGFMVRVRFAGISAVSDRGMSLSFWLKRRVDDPRFRKVEHYGGTDYGHHLRVTALDELDSQVQEWLCMAYEVGCQRATGG